MFEVYSTGASCLSWSVEWDGRLAKDVHRSGLAIVTSRLSL